MPYIEPDDFDASARDRTIFERRSGDRTSARVRVRVRFRFRFRFRFRVRIFEFDLGIELGEVSGLGLGLGLGLEIELHQFAILIHKQSCDSIHTWGRVGVRVR